MTVSDFSLEFRGIRFWNGPISRSNAEEILMKLKVAF